jgi:hypothetical protein
VVKISVLIGLVQMAAMCIPLAKQARILGAMPSPSLHED